MPKRTDIHKILTIGSGPIVIRQVSEAEAEVEALILGTQKIETIVGG
jgi:hypothetical protein